MPTFKDYEDTENQIIFEETDASFTDEQFAGKMFTTVYLICFT